MDIMREIAVPCICSFIACCAFGIQFNIRSGHLIAASVGSVVSYLIYTMLIYTGSGEYLSSFIAAAGVSLYAELMARRFKAPVNMYLIIGIIPLVPGGMIYYAMIALVAGDGSTLLDRLIGAFGTAGSIAMGIFAVSSAVRIIVEIYRTVSASRKKKVPENKKG